MFYLHRKNVLGNRKEKSGQVVETRKDEGWNLVEACEGFEHRSWRCQMQHVLKTEKDN